MKRMTVVLGLVQRGGRWFLQRRDPGNDVLPGLWEFPGGKPDPGESQLDALRRELREELGWEPSSLTALEGTQSLEHRYPDRIVLLRPYTCQGELVVRTNQSWGWFTMAEMRRLPIPEANRSLLERLC
jgi:mutator protein MutT